jgi:hypothetical protein
METIKLQTESYLFENSDGRFRAIPFYELSIEEWIVYENGQPKYLLDFNRREKPLIRDLKTRLDKGEELENLIWKLGRFLGRKWTTKHNINATEILDSQRIENIELLLIDDLSELFMDLTFVATDKIDYEILLNENKLFDTYLKKENGLESAFIDNTDNLSKLLAFVFKKNVELKELISDNDKILYDLTNYKDDCIKTDELETKYQDWINLSGRENNMDEYGNLIGIIGYIQNNFDKKHLVLITEKRKHFA